jgi:hypothetical protein
MKTKTLKEISNPTTISDINDCYTNEKWVKISDLDKWINDMVIVIDSYGAETTHTKVMMKFVLGNLIKELEKMDVKK